MIGFGTADVAGSCLAAWYYLTGVSAEMVSSLRGTATLGTALLMKVSSPAQAAWALSNPCVIFLCRLLATRNP